MLTPCPGSPVLSPARLRRVAQCREYRRVRTCIQGVYLYVRTEKGHAYTWVAWAVSMYWDVHGAYIMCMPRYIERSI